MKWSILFLATLLISPELWAWGQEGHRIVAQIAQDRLTPQAKKAVSDLLPNQDLAAVSTWADEIRSKPEWNYTHPWHFLDINDDENYETMAHSPEGDVISAITSMVDVLHASKSTLEEKQNALKFIVHFMGDIHQPLHVGRRDDRGGNLISIKFGGKTSNLHSLWDSAMIETEGMDYGQFATYLEGQSPVDQPQDNVAIPFTQIIKEDMGTRQQVYDFAPLVDAPVFITQSYVLRNRTLLHARLLTGGKRLAILLNQIFI